MKVLTLLLLAACACGEGAGIGADVAPLTVQPAPCEVVFSPEIDIAEFTENAALEWSEATGCDVHTGDGGIPISFAERITNDQGEPQCGVTHRVRAETGEILGASDIEISTAARCRLTARDVLHEMGHGLAPHRGHTFEGLMTAAPSGVDHVDDVAVRSICAELGC